jgi:hypothetical protein
MVYSRRLYTISNSTLLTLVCGIVKNGFVPHCCFHLPSNIIWHICFLWYKGDGCKFNGNLIRRVADGRTLAFAYDAKNHMVKVCEDGSNPAICDAGEVVVAQFTYDGDGKRVKSEMDSEIILFFGAHFEIKNGNQITKYYMAGSTRIAMRKYTIPQPMTVEYMLSDHLGSTSLTTDANGAKVLELRYKACPLRYTAGVLREGEIRAT